MTDYLDLLVTEGDFTLDAAANPLTARERNSLAQDIKHMVLETGLLIELVGERNPEKIQLNLGRIERKIDLDPRMVPGTGKVTVIDSETYYLTATTVDYGDLTVDLI